LADVLQGFPATNYKATQKVASGVRTPIYLFAALNSAAYLVLRKENHMQLIEAARQEIWVVE
jgi:hypothetical protein